MQISIISSLLMASVAMGLPISNNVSWTMVYYRYQFFVKKTIQFRAQARQLLILTQHLSKLPRVLMFKMVYTSLVTNLAYLPLLLMMDLTNIPGIWPNLLMNRVFPPLSLSMAITGCKSNHLNCFMV